MGHPNKQRHKFFRDQWLAAHDGSSWRSWGYAVGVLLLMGLIGLAFGALNGAFQMVKKGLAADLWRQSSFGDLIWIVAGAVVGGGAMYLFGRLRKKKVYYQIGLWAGALAGAAIVAPHEVLVIISSGALVYGILFSLACTAAVAAIAWAVGRPSATSSLVGGAAGGAVVFAILYLGISILKTLPAAPDDWSQAFHEYLSQLTEAARGPGILVVIVVGAGAGMLYLWTQTSEDRNATK